MVGKSQLPEQGELEAADSHIVVEVETLRQKKKQVSSSRSTPTGPLVPAGPQFRTFHRFPKQNRQLEARFPNP